MVKYKNIVAAMVVAVGLFSGLTGGMVLDVNAGFFTEDEWAEMDKLYTDDGEFSDVGYATLDLEDAINEGNITKAKEALAKNARVAGWDMKCYGDYHKPFLHYAVLKGDKDMVSLLIKYNADVNKKDLTEEVIYGIEEPDNTPLHCAVEKGSKEIVYLLLSEGANTNEVNHEGQTPLMLAEKLDRREIAALIENWIKDQSALKTMGGIQEAKTTK